MLKLYRDQNPLTVIGADDVTALLSGHNRRTFLPNIHKIYLRNDDITKWFSNIEILGESTTVDLVSGANGAGIKFYYGDLEPTERVWDSLPYNEPVRINTIGAVGDPDLTYKPIWLRIELAPYMSTGTYDFNFRMNYMEHLV